MGCGRMHDVLLDWANQTIREAHVVHNIKLSCFTQDPAAAIELWILVQIVSDDVLGALDGRLLVRNSTRVPASRGASIGRRSVWRKPILLHPIWLIRTSTLF